MLLLVMLLTWEQILGSLQTSLEIHRGQRNRILEHNIHLTDSIQPQMLANLNQNNEYISQSLKNSESILQRVKGPERVEFSDDKSKPKDSILRFPAARIRGGSLSNSEHLVDEPSWWLIKRLCNLGKIRYETCYRHGNAKCRCTGSLADCSGRRYVPNIPYVPKLPGHIKCLKFNFNDVKSLDDSYFANVSKFIVVDFSDNKLEKVSLLTFQRFTNLQYLILNRNVLSYKYLRPVFDYSPSFRLDILDQGLKEIPPAYFTRVKYVKTKQLYMDLNYIQRLDMNELRPLKALEYFSVRNCSIYNMTSAAMPGLKIFDLSYNSLPIFPQTCHELDIQFETTLNPQNVESSRNLTDRSFYPKLTELYLGYNQLVTTPEPENICLPQLKLFHLDSNRIMVLPEKAFSNFPSLMVLILDNQGKRGIRKIGSKAFSTPSLTTIYLSKTHINFHEKIISKAMFEGCSRLQDLVLSQNNFGSVNASDVNTLFKYTPKIRYLDLGDSNISQIFSAELSQLQNLQNLYLYKNNLTSIPDGAFDRFPALSTLRLDYNKISYVGRFSLELKSQLKVLDLSHNPYLCNCHLLDFQTWLNSANGTHLFESPDSYLCADRQNVRVQDYILSKQACLFSRTTYILFVVSLSLLMVLFIVFAVFYRYRWNIRLLLYERRVAARGLPLVNVDGGEFQYDLFLVFCNEDEAWIHGQLLPVLENQWGLQVCNHQRDFKAGAFITDNIVHSMNSSKRILVVIISRFALSKWCNYELQLCQSHVINHDHPSLLVIQRSDIQRRHMTASMLALYNTSCFLRWDTDRFWDRLAVMLQNLIQRDQ